MTVAIEENAEISLVKLLEEVDQHIPRIKTRSSVAGANAMAELSGTMLPMFRDLVSYVAALEAAVVRSSEATDDRLLQIEEGILTAAETDGGTQFEPEDADKFIEFLKASRMIFESLSKEMANPEPVRKKIAEMMSAADELIGIVEDCTIEESDESGTEEPQAGGEA